MGPHGTVRRDSFVNKRINTKLELLETGVACKYIVRSNTTDCFWGTEVLGSWEEVLLRAEGEVWVQGLGA